MQPARANETAGTGEGRVLSPGLYVVGTPIGDLRDITLRAIDVLRAADRILAEDTRVTRHLLARIDAHAPLISCHRFREQARVDETLDLIRKGAAIALVTDSGMPAVSDPGARLVAACREAGLPVTAVPGPSAVTAALALAGFECAGFYFAGFLPKKPGARARRLAQLGRIEEPIVLFESPHRFLKLLEELERHFPDRAIFVGRELTKHFEETRVGRASELRAVFSERRIRGEFTLVVGPKMRREDRCPEEAAGEQDKPPAAGDSQDTVHTA